jgi:DNA-binding GntR family transcriptional regulator
MDDHALSARIAGEIMQLISVGELAPDSHLSTQKLADRFKVSRTPVREALQQLADRGVLEQRLNRGYFTRKRSQRSKLKAARDRFAPTDSPSAYYRLAEDWLRDDVPGDVTEQFLRERYDLTKGQLSAILNRGTSEGWIERKAGYGWRLLPVAKTPEAFEQIYRFRLVIEPAALLEPTFQLNRPAAERMRATLQSMLDGNIELWPAARMHTIGVEFHEELAKMSGNPFLVQSLVRVNRFRLLLEYRSMIDRARVYQETREHLEITDLVLKGNLVEASFLMRQHLNAAIVRKRPAQRRKS